MRPAVAACYPAAGTGCRLRCSHSTHIGAAPTQERSKVASNDDVGRTLGMTKFAVWKVRSRVLGMIRKEVELLSAPNQEPSPVERDR